MDSNRKLADDPFRDLSVQIATGILLDGIYLVELDSRQHQMLADLHYAADEAGRMFGFRTIVHVNEPIATPDPTVTVTVRRTDATSPATEDRVRGLEALRTAVTREHLRLVHPPERSDDANG
jgi:hypothetical protein